MHPRLAFSVLFLLLGPFSQETLAQERLPIIDMHMHARVSMLRDADGKPVPIPCNWPDCEPRPTMVHGDEDVMNLALEAMDRHNVVLAALSDFDIDDVEKWKLAAPGRFLAGMIIVEPDQHSALQDVAGRLQIMGEIGTQYRGYAPNDPALGWIFTMAEELDLPALIHVAGVAAPNDLFRIAAGHPELLQEVLVRHPDLRLWFENAGYPFLEETIALMSRYHHVYTDISTITWVLPNAEFYRYLQSLMVAGLGRRLMWGSDQMNWPSTIDLAVDAIESAPFLSEEQKRDIFYNNAARFLRLSKETIAKHHGQ